MALTIRSRKWLTRTGLTLSGFAVLAGSFFQLLPKNVDAISGWDAGNIISDSVMSDSDAMSASQVQSFLNSKVTTCDTNGTRPSENNNSGVPDYNGDGTIQRWEWGKKKYNQTKFPCLKDYVQDGKKASQIIYEKSLKYTINPRVMIVLLQKEQGLVTDTWPINIQYRSATGYGCPDTAPCDSQYYGLSNQLDWAAKMFRAILNDNPNWYTPYNVGWNYIRYSPTSSCGGSNVNIKNRATQALYNYTPYQPNKGALNAGWGTATCGAYGNRNFYLYFTQWFGKINGGDLTSYDLRISSPITVTQLTESLSTVSFIVQNPSGSRVSFDKTIVQCRDYQKQMCDSNEGGAWYVDPGQARTFSYSVPTAKGNTYSFVPYVYMNGSWYRYDVTSGVSNTKTVHRPDLRLTSPISLNPTSLPPRTNTSVEFSLQNYGKSPMTVPTSVIQCRYKGLNCDSNYGGSITIQPNQKMKFVYRLTSKDGGSHTLIPYFMVDGQWYQYGSANGIDTTKVVNSADVSLTSAGVTVDNTSPIPGETVNVRYTVVNNGTEPITFPRILVQCRLNITQMCDSQITSNDTLAAGQQKTYAIPFKIHKSGSYSFRPLFEHIGIWHTYPKGQAVNNSTVLSVTRYEADMRLEGAIQLNPVNPKPGDTLSVSYRVKNYGSRPAYYQRSILQCRRDSKMCDPDYNTPEIVIQPGETRMFTAQFTNLKSGKYVFTPYFEQNNQWRTYMASPGYTNTLRRYVAALTINSQISISPSQPARNSDVTVTYTIQNYSGVNVNTDRSVLQCRIGKVLCDSSMGGPLTIEAGQQYTYRQKIRVSNSGTYTLIPHFGINKSWYTFNRADGSSDVIRISVP